MHYRPSGQDFVGQQVMPLYADGNWWLTAYHDVYFVQEDWVEQFTIHNDLDKTIHETRRLERGSRVIKGTELMTGVTAGAGFSGWGFSMNVGATVENKTFQSNETSEVQGYERTFEVEPKKSLFAYQKVYTFKLRVWFIWRDKNQFGGKDLVYAYSSAGDAVIKECVQTISCDQWYYSNEKLGSATVNVTIPYPNPTPREPRGAVCQWKNMNGASQHQIRTKYPSAAK
jgi:hypothetical protein